jgi:hypothetical protein
VEELEELALVLEELALGLQADPRGGGRPAGAPSRSSPWWAPSRPPPVGTLEASAGGHPRGPGRPAGGSVGGIGRGAIRIRGRGDRHRGNEGIKRILRLLKRR